MRTKVSTAVAAIICIFLFMPFTSCVGNLDTVEEYAKKTSKTNDAFYGYLKTGNINDAASMFSEESIRVNTYDSLKGALRRIYESNGTVMTYELIENRISKTKREGESRVEFIQTFKVKYANGFVAKEDVDYVLKKEHSFEKIDAYIFDYFTPPGQ